MRWAQGWSQVSMRHLLAALRSPRLGLRQKLGITHLLGWREVYPWLSLQVFPILAYWLATSHQAVDWFVPLFVLTTIFTMSVGPIQAYTGRRNANGTIRRHTAWWWLYLVATSLFYTEYKNVIARTAHIKEAMREKQWKVTPRAVPVPSAAPAAEAEPEPIDFPLPEPPRAPEPALAAPAEVEAPGWTATLAEPAPSAALPVRADR
jgi:hypothetical protein